MTRTGAPFARLAVAALLSALTSLSAVALMGTSAWLIARAAQHPSASSLTLAAVGVRSLALSRALFRYGERLVGHDAVLRAVAELRVRLFDAVRRSPARDDATDVSVLVSDVDAVQDLWLRVALPYLAAVVVASTSVLASWWFLPSAGAALLAAQGIGLVAAPVVAWWASGREARLAHWRAEQSTAVVDLLHGAAELLVLGGTAQALARAETAGARVAAAERSAAMRASVLTTLLLLLQGGATAAVGVAGAAAVTRGDLSPVLVAVLVLVALASFEPLVALADGAGVLRRATGALARVRAVLAQPGDEPRPVEGGLAGSVQLDGVGHRYPGRPLPAVGLPGLHLALVPGTAVGVVGGSGAGKSTLLRLVAGELRPTSGEVRVGSTSLSDLSPEDRARFVAVAAQDAHVFDASVADNLRVARPGATEAELRTALAVVGLSDWLAHLEDGLATPLGHRGVRMSGGERKRLCVARALLAPAPLLLLDEPTEGLEPTEADALLADVLAAARSRAVVVVTHRVAATGALDAVLVLDHGELVAQGTAADLRGRPGLFQDAWQLQVEQREELAA